MHIDENYHNLLKKILKEGHDYEDPNREGVIRKELASYTFKHSFSDGFPIISTKDVNYKNVLIELIWFLKGDTNIKYLLDNGVNIWNKDAYNYYCKRFLTKHPDYKQNLFTIEEFVSTVKESHLKTLNNFQNIGKHYTLGELGPVYGHQWVNTGGNQIQQLMQNMINKPMSSELIVNAWNADDLKKMALQPCHYGFQIIMIPLKKSERIPKNQLINFLIEPTDEELDNKGFPKYGFELHWNQRSCDTFLGIPYNIASYATLALILEEITGHKALGIQGDLKKVHIYDNSIDGVLEQLSRESNNVKVQLEQSLFTKAFEYSDFVDILMDMVNDVKLIDYNPQPAIRVAMLARTV